MIILPIIIWGRINASIISMILLFQYKPRVMCRSVFMWPGLRVVVVIVVNPT